MRGHRSEDAGVDPAEHELYVDKTLLGVLLEQYPAMVQDHELHRSLIEAPRLPEITEPDLADGTSRLIATGLAHRVDERMFVASASAVRAANLLDY